MSGHWSASACFYSSILLSLVAVVLASQQLLVLPNDTPWIRKLASVPGSSQSVETGLRASTENEQYEQHLRSIATRFQDRCRADGRPSSYHIITLQVPFMVLQLAGVTYIGGLCSVIFAPLAYYPGWNDFSKVSTSRSNYIASLLMLNAQVAVTFGILGGFCLAIWFPTSYHVHSLFRED